MYDEPEPVENKYFGWFTGIHPVARAAIMFALPFIAVDFFNYYSAGTALVISGPILAIMYAACGALAAKFAAGPDMVTGDYVKTGALAGLTLALQNTKLIALSGLITGIAAAMSMAASEYLSTRSEKTSKHPVRAAVYTGIAYIITVIFLILPYLLFTQYIVALAFTLLNAITIIGLFNYYLSVAKDLSFRRRFTEMAAISMGVAFISFIVGILVSKAFGVTV